MEKEEEDEGCNWGKMRHRVTGDRRLLTDQGRAMMSK